MLNDFTERLRRLDLPVTLWLAIIGFNLVSFYTTWLGLRLIFPNGEFVTREVIPFILAVAITLLLVYLTLEIRLTSTSGRSRLLLAYGVVAVLSIFFNFSAIYASLASEDRTLLSINEVRRQMTEVLSDHEEQARVRFGVSDYERRVARARTTRDLEGSRPDRQGEGPRWIALQAKYLEDSTELAVRIESMNRELAPAEEIRRTLDLPVPQNPDGIAASRLRIREAGNLLLALTSNDEGEPVIALRRVLLSTATDGGVEHTLNALFTDIQSVILTDATSARAARLYISVFLAALIDLTVLFVVFMTRSTDSRRSTSARRHGFNARASQGMWDQL